MLVELGSSESTYCRENFLFAPEAVRVLIVEGLGSGAGIRVSVCSPLSRAEMKPPFLLVPPTPALRLFHCKE